MDLNGIILCYILTVFTSCNGQVKQVESISKKTVDLGNVVSEIDKSIWIVFQDRKNNYWFGSNQNGLYRYDGNEIKQFTTKDGLFGNQIRGIQEDKSGNLYFETPNGISKFDGIKFVSLIPSKLFYTQWKLQPEDMWFKSYDGIGVCRYDGNSLYQLDFSAISSKKFDSNHSPSAIYKDKKGFIWFATLNAGVGCYNGVDLRWMYEKEMGALEDGRVPGIRSILEDKDGSFWFSNIIHQYNIEYANPKAIEYKKIKKIELSKQAVKMGHPYYTSALFDNETIWMTCYNEGVWKYDGKILTNYILKDGETNVLPMYVIKDHSGSILIGTDNAGVYKFNGNEFEKFKTSRARNTATNNGFIIK